jgi:cellulose biosynthesis protein BcsQ
MRDTKGILISVWVPGNHGAGGSTISIALGIALQHLTNKKTLIVNMGGTKNYMEQYIQNDVYARFSMDYLKSFDLEMDAEHIKTYSSPINEMLYVLPNCKIGREINKVGENFYQKFLEKSLQAYEIVIVDLETGLNKEKQMFLDKADLILAVMNGNEVMLKDLQESNKDIKAYIHNDKTLPLFNGLHEYANVVKALSRLNKSLDIKSSYGISFDNNANKAACFECKLYSFLKNELNKKKTQSLLAEQIVELSCIVLEKLMIPLQSIPDNANRINKFFLKVKQWGEIDV